jgi:beta-galactosidase
VELNWELVLDGKMVENGKLSNLKISPQETQTIKLPVNLGGKDYREAFLNISYNLIESTAFLEKGYSIAEEQLLLDGKWTSDINIQGTSELKVEKGQNEVTFSSEKATFTFDKKSGFLKGYQFDGTSIIEKSYELRPNFWRAPTDNDFGAGLQNKLKAWKTAMDNPELKSWEFIKENGLVVVSAKYRLNEVAANLDLTYKLNANGEITVEQDLEIDENSDAPMLFRVGMMMTLPKNFEKVEYYGRGPNENYSDRKESELIKVYDQSVDEQFFPYIRPQETGNKSDVRWLKLKSDNLILTITADAPFNFTALHYLMEDLDDGEQRGQRHAAEVKERDLTNLFIDTAQMGLGSINSWGHIPLEEYRLLGKKYQYTFKISPGKK